MKKSEMAKFAKETALNYGVKLSGKNIVILETGENQGSITYLMFQDKATNKQYQAWETGEFQEYIPEDDKVEEVPDVVGEEIVEKPVEDNAKIVQIGKAQVRVIKDKKVVKETDEEVVKVGEVAVTLEKPSKPKKDKKDKKVIKDKEHVILKAFTGMFIGEFDMVLNKDTGTYEIESKSGLLEFDPVTLAQLNAKNPRFANKIEIVK